MDSRTGERAGGNAPAKRRLRFGEFLLDTASQQLLRGDRELSLAPKAFRVLSLLAFHPGEVLTKDRLLDERILNSISIPNWIFRATSYVDGSLRSPPAAH